MGKIIEFIFTRVYVAMLVTGIFWVLTICGGVLLGVGPASATIMSLYAENGMTYKDYHWSRAWELFKENLRPANQVFYTFFAIEGILLYGMYLMIQIPHLNFFQILVLLFEIASSFRSLLCQQYQAQFDRNVAGHSSGFEAHPWNRATWRH